MHSAKYCLAGQSETILRQISRADALCHADIAVIERFQPARISTLWIYRCRSRRPDRRDPGRDQEIGASKQELVAVAFSGRI